MKMTKEELFDSVMEKNKKYKDMDFFSMDHWLVTLGVSKRECGILLSRSRSYVHKMLNGKINPTDRVMDHIIVLTMGKIRDRKSIVETLKKAS